MERVMSRHETPVASGVFVSTRLSEWRSLCSILEFQVKTLHRTR